MNGQGCSLCSRTFARHDLRYTPVGGGVRQHGSDYLCRQCWQVISGQPWPEQAESGAMNGGLNGQHSGSPPSPEGSGRPPLDRRQQQLLLQQQQMQAQAQAGSPASMDVLQRSTSAPMSGLTAAQAVHFTQMQQQQQLTAFGLQQQHALGRRSMSFHDIQQQQQQQQQAAQAMPIGCAGAHQRRPWQPASLPEQLAVLAGSDDPRWGNLAASASGSDHRRSRARGIGGGHYLGASAPVRGGLLSGSVAPQFNMQELGGMLDEASLELFESQSHLLDPDSLAALQKQRQLLDWQQGSVGDEAGTLAAATSMERQDSAGSGNEPLEVSNMKRQVKAALQERDCQAQRNNDLTQQLQDKKRQLFSAIQEREGLRQQVRGLEDKCREFQQALMCRMCRSVQRNCVVLPCLHFLYCEVCIKQHCNTSPSCPACNSSISGFHTLRLH
ncbi:expressed protein [Chlorella variabilis]|uniref:Expressed protein n=1 Tax=Chlorella variabilis TaxID=554065 RepID=E1Z858_CHLVA|nr:expressed protein [Chlorella variabilis]EFN58285.1 expressed protein [Chlorella variabilis]|eukprot:XP_005850387.1 expressed protein [Chlorella variabilis]